MAQLPAVTVVPTPALIPAPALPTLTFNPGDYATGMITAALTAIAQLGNIARDFNPPGIELVIDSAPSSPVLDQPTKPDLITIDFNVIGLPSPLDAVLDIEGVMPDPFDESAPTLTLSDPPASFSEASPTEPGITTDFGDPGELVVTMPTAPSLLSLNVVPFDGITMPTFSEETPTIDLTAPSVIPYEPGADYSSSLLTLLRSSLTARIEQGGTGLPPEAEQALWDRGRERELKAQADALDKLDQFESLGFAFPPGVFMDARLKVLTETNANLAGFSREVMIKQAELEQTNVLKALEQATTIEGKFADIWNQTEQRRFDSAKYTTEAQISIFNAKVSAYNGMLEAYKAKVQVYEAQIRAETAKVDAYRAQIAAEQAKADINKTLIDQYKVQSDIALSAIEIFKAQVDAIRVKAEIEKLKIEIFREQIGAYTAKVNAYVAQVEGYKAATSAEVSKQDAFKSKVQAYSATVDAASKTIDARIAELKGKIDAKQSEYDGYKSAVQGETARIQGLVSYNSALTDEYKADVQASASFNDSLTKQWQAQVEYIRGKAEVAAQVAKMNSDLIVSAANVDIEAAKAAGQIAAQIGAAALSAYNISASASVSASMSSGVSTSASVSASDSTSDSTSQSTSENVNHSDSTSTSTSENTNHSDSVSNSISQSFSDSKVLSNSFSQSSSDSDVSSTSNVTSTSTNTNYNL